MRPKVFLPSCANPIDGEPGQSVLDSYLDAVWHGAGGMPLVLPSGWLSSAGAIAQIIDEADGILLTGSPSNVEPRHYGGPPCPGMLLDPLRDALTLPLVRAALAAGVPVFGICRGLQEMNVALGGSLHPRVHESGFADHRAADGPPDRQYAPAHALDVVAGGVLAAIVGARTITVNSLHWQGIDRLATACRIEASAPDGLIEAISVPDAPGFALAVQWHPEWHWRDHPDSTRLWAAFGEALRQRGH